MAKVTINFTKGLNEKESLSFSLEKGGQLFVGTHNACEIKLPLEDISIADIHCSILFDGFGFYLVKSEADFITLLDDTRFRSSHRLYSGCKVTIGKNVEFIFDSDPKMEKFKLPKKIENRGGFLSKLLKRH